MDSFERFYPSEIARLVLGYLNDINCLYAWEIFLVECSDLQEHYTHYSQGKKHSTKVNGKSLHDVLHEYCKIKYEVTSEQHTHNPVDPVASNEESAEKNTERETSDATNLTSFATPSNVGIYASEKVNQTSTPLIHVTEVRSENVDVSLTEKGAPNQYSTILSDGANSGHTNRERAKFCDSDPPFSFKRPSSVQLFRKRKSPLKKKRFSHKVTQTDVLSVRDTDVQTELKLMYTNFRQHMAVASGDNIREEKASKSVDASECRNSDSDSEVESISSCVTEESCFVVPINKRKSFVPKRLLIDSVVHDKVEKQAKNNLKEILKDMQVGHGKIIKNSLNKAKRDPFLHSHLSLKHCRKDFPTRKLKCRPSAVNNNQMNTSIKSNCAETFYRQDTEAPQIDSSNICLQKNAHVECDNIKNKQIFESLEKICTSDIVFDDKTIYVDDCSKENNVPSIEVQDCKHEIEFLMPKCPSNVHSNPKKALHRKKVRPINCTANNEQILSMQNITTIAPIPNSAPTTSVILLENTSLKNLISLVAKTTTLNSVLNIQNVAPVESVASIANSAPMVSVMPMKTTAPMDSVVSIENTAPIVSVMPIQTTTPMDSVASIENTTPIASVMPIQTNAPMDPVASIENTVPKDPVASIENTAPMDPVTSIENTAPMDPVASIENTAPIVSVMPIQTTAPMDPIASIENTAPIVSVMPIQTTTPMDPVAFIENTSPIVSAMPIQTTTPMDPVASIENNVPMDHPVASIENTTPMDPVASIESNVPMDHPVASIENTAPMDPVAFIENNVPMDHPVASIENIAPIVSVMPIQITAPMDPIASIENTAPIVSVMPIQTTAPMDPVASIENTAPIVSVMPIQTTTPMDPVASIENTAPIVLVMPLQTTAPMDPIASIENTASRVSVMPIQATAPMDSVVSIENTVPMVSVMPLQTTAHMDSVVSIENTEPMVSVTSIQTITPSDSMMSMDSITNLNEGKIKPVSIGAPFTSQISINQMQQVSNLATDSIFLQTNQNICGNVSNLVTDSIFLPTNQNICGNNVIVGNTSNISNLVFSTFQNNSIFPPQFPYSGLSTLFVPNSSSNAFPMQNNIQYSLIINPNINWDCSSSNDVSLLAQTVVEDNSLQNQLVNNNIVNTGSEEVKSCTVEDQPEDDGTVEVIATKKVALKKKNINSIKSPVGSIRKRKIVVQKKKSPKTLNIKAFKSSSPPIRKRMHSEELKNKKFRRLLPLPNPIRKRMHSEELKNKKFRRLLPLPNATEGVITFKNTVIPLTSKAPNTQAFCKESADTDCGIDNISTEIEVADTQIPPLKSLLSSASLLAAKDAETNSFVTRSRDFFCNEAFPGNQSINSESNMEDNKITYLNLKSNKISHQSSKKPISRKKAPNKAKRKKVTEEDSVIETLTSEEISHAPSKVILDKTVSKNVSSEPKKKKAKRKNVDTHINDESMPVLSISTPESFDSQLSVPTSMALEVLNAMQIAIDMKSLGVLECNKQKFSTMKSEIFDVSNVENEDINEVDNFVSNTNIVLNPKVEVNETMDLNEINSELPISNEAPAPENETLDNICAFLKAEDFENSQPSSSSNSGMGSNMFLEKQEASTSITLDVSLGKTENCLLTRKNMPEQKNVELLELSNNGKDQVNVNEVIKRNSSRKVKVASKKVEQHSKMNKRGSKCSTASRKVLIPSTPITNVLKSKEFLSNTQSSGLEKSNIAEKGNVNAITHKYPLRTHHKKNAQEDFQLDSELDNVKKQCGQEGSKVIKCLGLTEKLENELDKQQIHPERAHIDSFTEQMSQSLLVSSDSIIKPFVINTNEISSPELFKDETGTCQETEDKNSIKYESSDQTKVINRQVIFDCTTDCQPLLKKLVVTIERMDSETITKAMFPNQVTNVDLGNFPSSFSTNSDMKRTSKCKKKSHSFINHKKISAKEPKLWTSTLPRHSILRSKQKQKPEDFLGGNELGDISIKNKSKDSIACSHNENSQKKSDVISHLKTFTVAQLEQDKVTQLHSSDTNTCDILIKNKLGEIITCSANETSRKSNIITPFKKFAAVQLEQDKEIQLESNETNDVLIKNKSKESHTIGCSLKEKLVKSDHISPVKKLAEIQLELEQDIIPSSLIATDECFPSNKIMLSKWHKKVPDIDIILVDISSEDREEVEVQQIQEESLVTYSTEETVLNKDIVPSILNKMEIFSPSKTVILADSHKKDSEFDSVKTSVASEEHIIGDEGSKAQQISKKSSREIQPPLSGEDTVSEVENQQPVSTVSIKDEIPNSSSAVWKKRKLFNTFTESKELTIGSVCARDEKGIPSSSHTSTNEPNKTVPRSILKKNPGRHFSIPSCVKSYEEWKAENSALTKIRRSRPTLKIVGFRTPEKDNTIVRASNTKVSNKKLKGMGTTACKSEISLQVDSSTLDSKLHHHQQNVEECESQQRSFNFTEMKHFKEVNNKSVKDLSASDINFETISSEINVNLGLEKVSNLKHVALSTQNQCYPEEVNTVQFLRKETVVTVKNEFVKNNVESGVENQANSCDKLNQGSEKISLLKELPSSNELVFPAVSCNDTKSDSCDKKLSIENAELTSLNVSIKEEEDVPLVVLADQKSNKLQTEAQNPDVAKRNKFTLNSSKCNSEELLSALSAEMVKSIKGVNPQVLLEQMREYGIDNLLNLLSEKE